MNKILVVDDAKNIILVVEMSLTKSGYEVYTAMDGITAVQKAQELEPDLILLDILLPKMNGFLVYEALKGDPKTENIPVIFLTAKAADEDKEKALAMGASDYIIKPVKQDRLLSSIKKTLSGSEQDE